MPQAETRTDPKPRLPDAQLGMLLNADPSRKYVWANPNDMSGVPQYEAEGFRIELYVKGGVRPQITSRKIEVGGSMYCYDQVLMSCDMEAWQDREKSRQKATVMEWEKKIRRNSGPLGDLRDPRGEVTFESQAERVQTFTEQG